MWRHLTLAELRTLKNGQGSKFQVTCCFFFSPTKIKQSVSLQMDPLPTHSLVPHRRWLFAELCNAAAFPHGVLSEGHRTSRLRYGKANHRVSTWSTADLYRSLWISFSKCSVVYKSNPRLLLGTTKKNIRQLWSPSPEILTDLGVFGFGQTMFLPR